MHIPMWTRIRNNQNDQKREEYDVYNRKQQENNYFLLLLFKMQTDYYIDLHRIRFVREDFHGCPVQ